MIFAYDWVWPALSSDERATISAALASRLTLLASQIQPKFSLTQPTPADNSLSHPMRFISTLGQGGLALLHENKAAPGWLAWSYEYYLRQFPVWGGPAGGWAEGLNYWGTGLTQHLRFLEGLALLGHGEPLARPFWRNTAYYAVYNQMPYAGSSFGDLNNLVRPNSSVALLLAKLGLLDDDPRPVAFAQAMAQKLPGDFGYYNFNAFDTLLHRFRSTQTRLPAGSLADLPQGRLFDDIGIATLHSALGNAGQDIMFALRASPLGTASHAFSDQNSFVLNAFGEPLAISSGYREFYGSAHHTGWTRQTRAKNAILFGGEGQRLRDASATGRILRFVDLPRTGFISADALEAYKPHATRALRHVLFVDRRYFVILDEVAAPSPVSYQWLLHARREMQLDPANGQVRVSMPNARLDLSFLHPAADALAFSQTDAFDPPVLPAYEKQMPREWHFTAVTRTPAARQEFLTVLQPGQAQQPAPARAQAIAAETGHALRLQAGEHEEIVLISRQDELRVSAAGWQLQGQAASFIRDGRQLRFALIGATRLTLPAGFNTVQPAERLTDGRLRVQLPAGRSQIVAQQGR
ncbi:MAG: hypothetical protein CGU29_05020 [Candidatus Dactylopiibacterium carminicum]|uniref:Uncharacterized protein n=2 Tax=Candidatus Dactylopiibacterium carminicum TaxID=857335 RepID=A0A272EVW0_9RHOO|nr:hypothetical protein BGI27_05320 [Candidatus Dactylopiibacterium carminicum]PAS94186.1 MAG: hypothetical protein CGU29_05020 [Candidatus Dactylopiibacterium carminicum]PAS99875.1 MAG: hypothetical protein BSR46_05355 [Candidatus Dactylopiibacterium carminicum]